MLPLRGAAGFRSPHANKTAATAPHRPDAAGEARPAPEAAAGGAIGLVRNGDKIRIDIPNRTINVLVSDEELARRREEQRRRRTAWTRSRARTIYSGDGLGRRDSAGW